ncbi:putative flavoprotein involved in K+ transport [Conyzicola lurida]|uniref:Putative flavoprotein involved in K+ transport n=1 Tax=Conyzicola lurida TaxID=1172621 RepID=A0A841AGQ9_9MICO|nr:putative flavoprotein involved in K+ transport [Conyzicola lurida]
MSNDARALPDTAPAVVVGAGPAGLAAAAELGRVGIHALVIDSAGEIGSSWAHHYDRLHLHTARALSALPGMPIPRSSGRWVARDDFRSYLRAYAERHGLDVHLSSPVTSVDRLADGLWRIGCRGQTIVTPIVVIATGYNHTPVLPDWPGRERFEGRIMHSSDYRNPADLAADSVLVVGPGNSGAEIAADLAEAGKRVWLAVRTPPNIVRRQVAGIPSQLLAILMSPFPAWVGDGVGRVVRRISVGDLSRFGLPAAPLGVVTRLKVDDVPPLLDVGLVAAVRAGRVTVVAAVASFDGHDVRLADGEVLRPDAVVVATGYTRGLDSLVGHLGVVAPNGRPAVNAAEQAPGLDGLYFLGYSNPLTGNIRQLGIDARAIARRAGKKGDAATRRARVMVPRAEPS